MTKIKQDDEKQVAGEVRGGHVWAEVSVMSRGWPVTIWGKGYQAEKMVSARAQRQDPVVEDCEQGGEVDRPHVGPPGPRSRVWTLSECDKDSLGWL